MAFKLTYSGQYQNLNGTPFRINIYRDTDDTITVQNIECSARIIFDEARNLEPIRKSRAEIQLLAGIDQTFFDLLPQSELDIRVDIVTAGNKIFFTGFVLADGFFQDYVNEKWQCTLIATDGLDLLTNYAYVDENGGNFTGTQTTLEVLHNALKRTGHNLDIYIPKSGNSLSFPDPQYVIDAQNSLYGSFWNTRVDNIAFYGDEPKTCEEVINELIKISGYSICQQNGDWVLTRVASFATSQFNELTPTYQRYIDGVFFGNEEIEINQTIGDEVAGYFPHWCNANQKIEAAPSLGANRAVYDFGEPKTLIENFELDNDGSTMADWTILQTDPNLFEFENTSSIKITTPSGNFNPTPEEMIRTTITGLLAGDILKIQTKWFAITDLTGLWFQFRLTNTDTSTDYYFSSDDNTWKSGGVFSYKEALTTRFNQLVTAEITTAILPENGDLEITLLEPFATSYDFSSNFNPFDKEIIVDSIRVNIEDGSGAIGQEITSQRIANPSSVTQENVNFFLGGTLTQLEYDGTLLDSSDNPITTGWVREFSNDAQAIMVAYLEDFHILRGSTSLYFSGDVFGYFPYVSRISIVGLTGTFHVVGYEYDTYTDIVSLVLLQLHSDTTVYADLDTDIIIKYSESENAKIS